MLPNNIEKQILEYLHLEYGEDPDAPDSLQLSDLSYAGEHLVEGIIQHCWKYPSLKDDMWATVEIGNDGSYTIGMAPIPEPENKDFYANLLLIIEGKNTKKVRIPYLKDDEYDISCFEDAFDMVLENGKKLSVYSEVGLNTTPPQFSLSVEYDGRDMYLKGVAGIELRLSLETDIYMYVDIGKLN